VLYAQPKSACDSFGWENVSDSGDIICSVWAFNLGTVCVSYFRTSLGLAGRHGQPS
jgi:hypothetical protein